MADAGTDTYDGQVSGNFLVLGSTGSGKTSLVQRLGCNGMFGELQKVHWISKVELSKCREAEIESCFSAEVEFYNPQEEYEIEKTFRHLENIYREREENKKSTIGEYVERDSLVVLDDVSRLADRSTSFVNFMTTCKKFGHSLIYVFHETAVSSPRWKAILLQAQMFCIFPSAINLIINPLVKFTNQTKIRYVSRQQIWLTKLFRGLSGITGYTSLCMDNRPHVIGAGKYRSDVENPNEQQCYLDSDVSDKLFNTFICRRTNNTQAIEFASEKQVRIMKSGYRYQIEPK